MSEDLDDDGYPTEGALSRIRAWPFEDCAGLMAFVHSVWNWPDWGWTETAAEGGGTEYRLATGGWSGNEDVIDALGGNRMFWMLCWQESKRGGGFTFIVRPLAPTPTRETPTPESKNDEG